MRGTLTPTAGLTLDDGHGFVVVFEPGTVDQTVTVTADRIGALESAPSRGLTVYGDLYRIGFSSPYTTIAQNVYVQIPWLRGARLPKRICSCIARPYYPDPMPWSPRDPVYANAENWQELAETPARDRGDVVACLSKRIGSMLVGKK
ncbi:MAG: hypothetical protein R3F39_14530 [Myxococcota bacterium]